MKYHRWKETDFGTEVTAKNSHILVLVHINGIVVYRITEKNVRIADFCSALDDFCPDSALILIAGNHCFKPFITYRHCVGRFLDRMTFLADI